MPKTGKPSATRRVTAVYADGNTLMAAVVSLSQEGRPRIHALRLVETEELVERVERIPHPIFMNSKRMVFPMQEILYQALDVLLEGDEFHNPVVGVMPPDLTDLWIDESSCTAQGRQDRVRAGIKAMLDGNPYGYPKLISYDLLDDDQPPPGNDRKHVRLWTCRFDDVLAIADQLLRLDLPFAGIVTAQRALMEVVSETAAKDNRSPVILIDIGKLRTSYLGLTDKPRTFTHAIPVGLARDDNRYFSSFVPTLQSLRALAEASGRLLIPPDYTPSSLYDTYPATPQMEVTHFASHVSEYATRLLKSVRANNGRNGGEVVALAGLPAALPGLHDYLEARTATVIVPFEEYARNAWEADDPETLARARNHLPAIGGAVAFLRREQSRFGIVLRERRPMRFAVSSARIPDVEPETVYVLEWGSRE